VLELGPARKPVLASDRQLSRSEDHPIRYSTDPREGIRVSLVCTAKNVFGLVAQLLEIRPGGEIGHDVSFASPWSASGRKSSSTDSSRTAVEVDSVLPADPGAPSGTAEQSYPLTQGQFRPESRARGGILSSAIYLAAASGSPTCSTSSSAVRSSVSS